MLTMQWMTGHDGRLVATWTQSAEPGSPGGREETIMLKMKWTMDHEGRLVPTPAQSGEPQSSKDPPGSKVRRLVSRCLLTIMRTVHRELAALALWKSIRHASPTFAARSFFGRD
jgi:hypothetical protein